MPSAVIELLIALCAMNPCVLVGDTIHVPVPNVSQREWPEVYERFDISNGKNNLRIILIPIPKNT
jgi:hypothetical protein